MTARKIAFLGTVVVAVYAVIAVLQTLVWNPLAAAPGKTIEQIYADVAGASESMHVPFVLAAAAVVVGLAGLAWWLTSRDGTSRDVTAAIDAGLLVMGALAYFWMSFGPGMSLADTYGISGGDHAPWASVLYLVSLMALAGLTVLTVRYVRRAEA